MRVPVELGDTGGPRRPVYETLHFGFSAKTASTFLLLLVLQSRFGGVTR